MYMYVYICILNSMLFINKCASSLQCKLSEISNMKRGKTYYLQIICCKLQASLYLVLGIYNEQMEYSLLFDDVSKITIAIFFILQFEKHVLEHSDFLKLHF